jgi:diketogulonate reductase-like aldo/keto reductase
MFMNTVSGKPLSRIGIGSYGVGGRGHRDMEITEKVDDQTYIDALVHVLGRNINFTELSLGYGHGQAVVLFKRALDESQVSRKDLFITHSLYTRDLPSIGTINQDIADFYEAMGTDYADSTLVTQSILLKFGEKSVYQILRDLLDQDRTRYVSLSNASPTWIRRFHDEFGESFFAHEGHLSYEVRALQDKGVFTTCNSLHVENIVWRPLRRNQTGRHNWDTLVQLAEKYRKTQNQIVLNWLCHEGYRPMVFSTNKKHIDENVEAPDFDMERDEYELINKFRPPNYVPPEVDWEGLNIDDDIVRLVSDIDSYK